MLQKGAVSLLIGLSDAEVDKLSRGTTPSADTGLAASQTATAATTTATTVIKISA